MEKLQMASCVCTSNIYKAQTNTRAHTLCAATYVWIMLINKNEKLQYKWGAVQHTANGMRHKHRRKKSKKEDSK